MDLWLCPWINGSVFRQSQTVPGTCYRLYRLMQAVPRTTTMRRKEITRTEPGGGTDVLTVLRNALPSIVPRNLCSVWQLDPSHCQSKSLYPFQTFRTIAVVTFRTLPHEQREETLASHGFTRKQASFPIDSLFGKFRCWRRRHNCCTNLQIYCPSVVNVQEFGGGRCHVGFTPFHWFF